MVISKRQVVRLLTAKLETFRVEDEEVLTAGLRSSDRFDVFRTGPSKSRLAFLCNLLGRDGPLRHQ